MIGLVSALLPVLFGQPAARAPGKTPAPVNVAGYVYNAYTNVPIAGVAVTLVVPNRRTRTSDAGRFEFAGVPVGARQLQFGKAGMVRDSLRIDVRPNKRVDVRVALRPDDSNVIVITDRLSRTARRQVVETTITRDQGGQVAGTQGDMVKVVQTLGGVARARAGTSDLVVWGASPSDTRLYVDDVPVPRLFHIGGSRSILSSRNVSAVSLIPGGFGAAYGRAIGGMVKVATADPSKQRVEGFASADPIDVSAGTSTRLSPSMWTSIGARTSLQNQSLDLVASDRTRELVPLADYWDYQLKTQYDVNSSDTLKVLAFGVRDRVARGIPSITPDSSFLEDSTSMFHRLAVRLERAGAAGVTNTMIAWLGIDDSETAMQFGADNASASQRSLRAGLRLEEQRRLRPWVGVRFGLDLELSRTTTSRDGALSLPPREGDITVFGQPPGNRINMDKWRTDIAGVGAYVAAAFTVVGNRLHVEPGLRLEPSVLNGNRVVPVRATEPAVGYTELQPALDPRVRVSFKASPRLRIYAAAGRYHQTAAAGDLSPVFGTPILDQAEALHTLAGVSARPAPWATVDVTGFWIRQRHLAVRAPSATPALAELLVSQGQGRNYGVQVALRFRPSSRLFAWLTYSFMRAQRRADAMAAWRLFDFDQTHVGQAVVSYRHSSGIELGARMQLTTGAPRTPVQGAVFNAGSGLYDPIFGAHNSIRIPAFFELSLRVAWKRTLSWGSLQLWLDVQNATNRSNAEEIIYTSDYSQRGFITGLPILPLVGAQVRL